MPWKRRSFPHRVLSVCHLSVAPPSICMKYAPVLYWKAPCMFWPSLLVCAAPFSMGFFLGPPMCLLRFCMVLPSFLHSHNLPRLNGLESGCAILVRHPRMHEVCTCLYWKVPRMFWPSLLVCATPHRTAPYRTALHCTTYTTFIHSFIHTYIHYITFHSIPLHCIALHSYIHYIHT